MKYFATKVGTQMKGNEKIYLIIPNLHYLRV